MAKSSDRFELFSRFAVAESNETTEQQNFDATKQTPNTDGTAESTAWVNERMTACYND